MPKIYSHDLKLAIINFNKSELWNIDEAIKIFGSSRSSIYSWIKLNKESLINLQFSCREEYNSKITNEIEKYIVMYVQKRIFKI